MSDRPFDAGRRAVITSSVWGGALAALSGIPLVFERQLERAQLRVLGELLRHDLVHGDLADDVGLAGPSDHAGQKRRRTAGVRGYVPGELETRQEQDLIAKRLERLKDGRDFERRPFAFRRPIAKREFKIFAEIANFLFQNRFRPTLLANA